MNIAHTQQEDPILVVAATNRPGSLTEIVANYYITLLQKEGKKASLLSLSRLASDFTATALYANKGKDPAFNALSKQIEQAKKMVIVVPQYNGSFPGILKTFIDGLKVGAMDKGEVFRYKKCALVGVSKGYQGNIMGLSHLTDYFRVFGHACVPVETLLIKHKPAFDGSFRGAS